MGARPIDVSIIIVNYNVKHFAEQCLRSIYAGSQGVSFEIFLVDNGSTDDSLNYLRPRFPEVKFIDNAANLGFGKANNVAMRQSSGRYLLILNPDTLVREDSLQILVKYMDANPIVGAVGPKILTRDGGFDKSSKRGLPTPWASFCRVSGLSKLFPKSPLFGKYDLLYIDPDQIAEVDALVGSCMMVRYETYTQTGGFDEDYFMYGEDIDWSYRIKLAGWKVHYVPLTHIVHFRGESTRRSANFNRDRAFYGAMHLFAEKHFRRNYSWLGHKLIDLGIVIAWLGAKVKQLWIWIGWAAIDWIVLWSSLGLGRLIRWGEFGFTPTVVIVHAIYATVWIGCLAGLGAYGSRRGMFKQLFAGIALGFFINSSFNYFFKDIAYSRVVNLLGAVIGGLLVWLWRAALLNLHRTRPWRSFYKRRTFIIGVGATARKVATRLKMGGDLPYLTVGFIDPTENTVGSIIDEIPVLGGETELYSLLQQEQIEEVIFAYDQVDYDHVLKVVEQVGRRRGVNFKVITPETAASHDGLTPLLSVEYLSPRGLGRSLRKIATLVVKQ